MFPTVEKNFKKYCLFFMFSGFFLYLISISKEMSYGAQMLEITGSLNASKSMVGLGLTIYYVIYSLSQVLVAIIIKKINMRRFMAVTISLSAVSYTLVMFVNSLWQMWLLYAVNGFLQSGLWGGIMYFFGKHVPKEMSGFIVKLSSAGLPAGTALTYGVSALFVSAANWRVTFLFFGILLAVALVLFLVAETVMCRKFPEKAGIAAEIVVSEEQPKEMPPLASDKSDKKGLIGVIAYTTVLCFFVCCVYYAISNWVPNLLNEVYGMPSSYSILLTLLIPLGALPGPIITTSVAQKRKNGANEICFVFSLIALLFSAGMCFLYNVWIVLAILFSVIILMTVRGVSALLATYIPLLLNDKINSGTLTLIVNAGACAGAAFMPYLSGLILDGTGNDRWIYYYIFVTAIALVAMLISVYGIIRSKRKAKKNLSSPI